MDRADLLISTDELAAIADRPGVRVVDVRWSLDDPDEGEHGQRKVCWLEGGLPNWVREGRPVEAGRVEPRGGAVPKERR